MTRAECILQTGLLECFGCHKIFPATPEYFRRSEGGIKGLGLSRRCKPCDLEYFRKWREGTKGKHGGKRDGAGQKGTKRISKKPKWAPCLKCEQEQVDRRIQYICQKCRASNRECFDSMAEGAG